MEFEYSSRSLELQEKLGDFIRTHVDLAGPAYQEQVAASGDPHFHPPVMEELKAEARKRGLWNLFLPNEKWGAGLSNLDYAPLCEMMGKSLLTGEATNCAAPDTGNMEILAEFGTPEQQDEWLVPLLNGEIRSCFAMTEPWVASSDATNIQSRIEPDGDHYIVNAHKWWTSGAASDRCKVAVLLGVSNPDADPYHRHSMILVPFDAPGVKVVRTLPVFGHDAGGGHCETLYQDVRLPASSLLGEEGGGFSIAQARLGPGRIHHCMRTIGAAERALELLCDRLLNRVAFGKPLAEQGVWQERIANARIDIDQARLYTFYAAWLMDTQGNKAARTEIAGIKVAVPLMALRVIDDAIQGFGAAGVSQDTPLAQMYAGIRTLRLADGPDEVHRRTIAQRELRKHRA
ncbi:MAG: acyl-CoA dehydrogenase family protein [Acidimicrobiia bacterium]